MGEPSEPELPAAVANFFRDLYCRLKAKNESARKHLGAHTRKGNASLRTALIEATVGAYRSKKSYFRDKCYRLKARCGHTRAWLAIAHKILIAVHRVLFEA